MPEVSETVRALSRGLFEGFGIKLTEGLKRVVDHVSDTLVNQVMQDVFSVKGHWDDTVVNIIKAKFRKKRGQEAYQALLRLFGFLTEPEYQEFGVISIGILAITQMEEVKLDAETTAPKISKTPDEKKGKKKKADKKKDKDQGKKPLSVVERNLGLFLDFDFTEPANYATLFVSWDFLISDFLKLEDKGQANRETVVKLMHQSSLYADNTLKKRLAGLLMHVRDWPATLKRWRKKGWGRIVNSFQTVGNYFNTELDQPLTELEQHSINVLARARERFNNRRQR